MNHTPDSSYAWVRLLISLALATVGGIGLWSCVVALPAIQTEFGIDRAGASLPYTVTFVGFAICGLLTGKLADKLGITVPLFAGAICLGAGFILDGLSASYHQFWSQRAFGRCDGAKTAGPSGIPDHPCSLDIRCCARRDGPLAKRS